MFRVRNAKHFNARIACAKRLSDMDYYAPIFSGIVDSSLWAEPDHVCKMFVTLLAMKDSDYIVRQTAFALGKICWPKDLAEGVAERRALDALHVLSQPDKSRIEKQPFEGRRIEKVEDGWLILNGEAYRKKMQKINGRLNNAERQRRHREKKSQGPSASYRGRERRFERAHAAGDHKQADEIAAEGLK